MTDSPKHKKKSALAASALSIIPGAGHLYLGQTKKAVVMALTAPVSIFFAWHDAHVMGKRIDDRGTVGDWEFFWSQSKWNIVDTEDLQTSDFVVARESRIIDNSSSDSLIERHFEELREWTASCTIEEERIETKTVSNESFSLGGRQLAGMFVRARGTRKTKTVETTLRERFARTTEEKHSKKETFIIRVAPRTRTEILMKWKHHVQCGTLVLEDQFQNTIRAPFRVVTSMTFDQAQLDGPRKA